MPIWQSSQGWCTPDNNIDIPFFVGFRCSLYKINLHLFNLISLYIIIRYWSLVVINLELDFLITYFWNYFVITVVYAWVGNNCLLSHVSRCCGKNILNLASCRIVHSCNKYLIFWTFLLRSTKSLYLYINWSLIFNRTLKNVGHNFYTLYLSPLGQQVPGNSILCFSDFL